MIHRLQMSTTLVYPQVGERLDNGLLVISNHKVYGLLEIFTPTLVLLYGPILLYIKILHYMKGQGSATIK